MHGVRREDIQRLKTGYPTVVSGGPDSRLADFADLSFGNAIELGDQILKDLSPDTLGVAWWHDHLDETARVAVSDQLIACVRGITSNLLEAYVSLLEYRHAIQEFDELLQRGAHSNGSFRMPQPRGPYDDVVAIREEAHVAGVARALGSTLDCFGGAVVGVAWLPTNLVKADYGTAQRALQMVRRGDPRDSA